MRRALLVTLLVLGLPGVAAAGGSQVDLAATPHDVFVVGDAGLREFDAATGRVVWAPRPAAPRYQLSVAVAGGALFVASIANGYVDGRLTRIDLRTRAERVLRRVPRGSVLEVAAGAGGVWALIGESSGNRLERFTSAGGLEGSWPVGAAGHIAADQAGCWVSAEHRLLLLDAAGRLRVVARAPFGELAAGAGAVWIGLRRALVRVDERTGAATTIRTGNLDLGGFQHELTVGDGSLWVLGTGALERRDLRTGRLEAAVLVPRIAHSVALTPTGVWVGTTQGLRRLDPRTLRTDLRLRIV